MPRVKKCGTFSDIASEDTVADVEDVLRRLVGTRVRLHCVRGVPYENPVVGLLERVTAGHVLVRVHPTRIDDIPVTDIVDVELLKDDEG